MLDPANKNPTFSPLFFLVYTPNMPFSTAVLPIALVLVCIPFAFAQKCPAGQFSSGDDCKLCPKGTYQSFPNSSSCNACPEGTYNPYLGALGIDICTECPPNTFSSSPAATSRSQCLPCQTGQFSPRGSSFCLRCKPGEQAVPKRGPPLFSDQFYTFFRATRFICTGNAFPVSCTRDAPL